jgi:hypothetical protein
LAFLSAVGGLIAVPLTVITFYLRSLREHQVTWHGDLLRRVESVEGSAVELRKALAAIEHDFTTKEEWLRECMLARQQIAQLAESAVRFETILDRVGTPDRAVLPAATPCPVTGDREDVTQAERPTQGNR